MTDSLARRVSLPRLLIVLPVALVLMWLVLRQLVLLLLASSPDLPLQPLWPVSGATLIAESDARTTFAMNGKSRTASRLDRALLDDPLAPEPFYTEAVARIRHGDHLGAIRLLEQARRREPRWALPRVLLTQQYLVAGKINDAIDEIAALIRVGTNVGDQLLEVLVPLTRDPATRPAVISTLRRDPQLRQAFVSYVTRQGGDASLLFKSLVDVPDNGGTSDAQAAVVNLLVSKGDFQRAYLAWINFLPEKALSGIAFIYDGNFAGLPGPPPFNWHLSSDASGNAEYVRKSGLPQPTALEASYFGEQPSLLAEQTIVLEPGSYVFSYSAIGSRDGDLGGSLSWSLRCVSKTGVELFRSGLLPSTPTRIDVRFAVPAADCPAQVLALTGTAGDVPATIRADYSGLTVSRSSHPVAAPKEQGAP